MQKSKDHINHEPVSEELHLEEVADIPEKVSMERSIEGSDAPETAAFPDHDFEGGEELGDIKLNVTESRPVIDDFAGAAKKGRRGVAREVPDISSLASEVDVLTRVSKPDAGTIVAKKEVAAVSPETTRAIPAPEYQKKSVVPAEKKDIGENTINEIVIYEDDDIDIDYYSLEELEGASSAGMMDMPEAEFAAEVKVPEHKKADTGEFPEIVDTAEEEERHVEKDTLTFEIPDDVREKTTEELELGEWDAIDLNEAEKIANEDILFLREDDLIEELEEFDLVPVAAEPLKKKKMEKAGESLPTPLAKKEAVAGKDHKKNRDREAQGPKVKIDVSEIGGPSPAGTKQGADAQEFIPEIVAEEIVLEPDVEGEKADIEKGEIETISPTGPRAVRPGPMGGGMPDAGKSVGTSGLEVLDRKDAGSEIHAIDIDEEGEIVTVKLDKPASTEEITRLHGKDRIMEYVPPAEPSPPAHVPRISAAITRERIPEELVRAESPGVGAVFIDDELVDKKPAEKTSIFEVNDLERITSEIVEIIEGEAKLLVEADVSDDRDRIASVMKGQTPAFEDLLIDIEGEYSFKDDEMGVIDNAFAAEDYGRYIGAIDEFSESGAEKSISSAVELLGLDFGELGSIEQISFLKEYEKIDIDGILASARAGMDQPAGDLDILKRCTYIVSKKNSILEEERNSIEEDISARSAIVLEESVDELRNRLDDIRLRRSVSPEEGIQDISDSVIIIDNGRDIERFVESMPEGKRDIMRKLLKYLDGLFEKLPEDVIKNFAKSEYFDLYSKVMNDLGV